MKKKNNKRGFTLAELLIVVAIIAVLVAIDIPIFTTQLEKSRESTDLANLRSAYAEQVTRLLSWDGTAENKPAAITVQAQQTQAKWQSYDDAETAYIGNEEYGNVPIGCVLKNDTSQWSVAVNDSGTSVVITPDGT